MGIYRKLIGVTVAVGLLLGLNISAMAFAASVPTNFVAQTSCTSATACVNQGVGQTCSGQTCSGTANNSSISSVIRSVLDILSILVGVAAVIMIVIGGLRYIISGGDSNATAGAKNTIIYAIVGLIIALLAQVLVQFVLAKTAGK
jgi:hypothetical protein